VKEGLYKVQFHTSRGQGRGVIYASGGKLRGGNSAFAFIGSYKVEDGEIMVRVSTTRHTEDPQFLPLFGMDRITAVLRGSAHGDLVDLEGTALQVPDQQLKVVLTPISD
jgi:T3SS negative regulator,GrlR